VKLGCQKAGHLTSMVAASQKQASSGTPQSRSRSTVAWDAHRPLPPISVAARSIGLLAAGCRPVPGSKPAVSVEDGVDIKAPQFVNGQHGAGAWPCAL
jgi:hypothetical protein